jgi:hypothetical protein
MSQGFFQSATSLVKSTGRFLGAAFHAGSKALDKTTDKLKRYTADDDPKEEN